MRWGFDSLKVDYFSIKVLCSLNRLSHDFKIIVSHFLSSPLLSEDRNFFVRVIFNGFTCNIKTSKHKEKPLENKFQGLFLQSDISALANLYFKPCCDFSLSFPFLKMSLICLVLSLPFKLLDQRAWICSPSDETACDRTSG